MKVLKVVCDVTVYLEAALLPAGDAGRLLRRFVERRDFELVMSQEILDRIERAFGDPEIRNSMPSPSESRRWSAALGVLTTVVEVEAAEPTPALGQDARDDLYLDAIRAAGGGLIVTSDPRLLAVTDVPGVEVVTPGAVLELLEAQRRVSPQLRRPPR